MDVSAKWQILKIAVKILSEKCSYTILFYFYLDLAKQTKLYSKIIQVCIYGEL